MKSPPPCSFAVRDDAAPAQYKDSGFLIGEKRGFNKQLQRLNLGEASCGSIVFHRRAYRRPANFPLNRPNPCNGGRFGVYKTTF